MHLHIYMCIYNRVTNYDLKEYILRGNDESLLETNEPPRGKTNNVVSDQIRHKSGCTVRDAG